MAASNAWLIDQHIDGAANQIIATTKRDVVLHFAQLG